MRARRSWSVLLFAAGLAGGCAGDSATAPDTTPPAVRLLSPAATDPALATAMAGFACPVAIEADDDEALAMVVLHVDDDFVRVADGPPWQVAWDTTVYDEGSVHRLWATATDASGNRAASEVRFARVLNHALPVVLSDPAEGALVRGVVSLTASFPEGSPPVAAVEFFADRTSVGTATASPWSLALDTTRFPAGAIAVRVQARSTAGEVGVSDPVTVFVNNEAPDLGIDFPDAGHAVASRGTLVLDGHLVEEPPGTPDPDRLVWTSDVDGELGRGPSVWVSDLTPGPHRITLTGTNAWGSVAATSVDVEVLAQPTYEFCEDVYLGFFERQVCVKCHNPASSQYPLHGLDLKSYGGVMSGGYTTAFRAVYPCRPESSLIVNKVTAEAPWVGDSMPLGLPGQFPPIYPDALEKLRVWIREGAPPDPMTECHE